MNNGTILDKDSYMSLDTMIATWALGSISSNLGSHYLMIEIKKCEFFKNLDWPTLLNNSRKVEGDVSSPWRQQYQYGITPSCCTAIHTHFPHFLIIFGRGETWIICALQGLQSIGLFYRSETTFHVKKMLCGCNILKQLFSTLKF